MNSLDSRAVKYRCEKAGECYAKFDGHPDMGSCCDSVPHEKNMDCDKECSGMSDLGHPKCIPITDEETP